MTLDRIRFRIQAAANDEKCVLDGRDAWTLLNRIEELEAALEAAPHGEDCALAVHYGYPHLTRNDAGCTCWKASVRKEKG
jgi:hypothetical protein